MIFSIVPNSMAEERTVSGVTWLNSALRNRQMVSTIVDQLQVRQYYGFQPQVRRYLSHPMFEFYLTLP
jgi:hypothetical protein